MWIFGKAWREMFAYIELHISQCSRSGYNALESERSILKRMVYRNLYADRRIRLLKEMFLIGLAILLAFDKNWRYIGIKSA